MTLDTPAPQAGPHARFLASACPSVWRRSAGGAFREPGAGSNPLALHVGAGEPALPSAIGRASRQPPVGALEMENAISSQEELRRGARSRGYFK